MSWTIWAVQKGTTAVDEFLQRNVHFAFREQTFIQVKRAEAIFDSKFIQKYQMVLLGK